MGLPCGGFCFAGTPAWRGAAHEPPGCEVDIELHAAACGRVSNHRIRSDAESLPLAERAGLGGHAELCPGRAAALGTAAGASKRGGVPLWAGFADSRPLGKSVGRRGGQAAGCPV